MPRLHLTTFIAAPIERVFDLSRSIDLHKKSFAHKEEQAVSGTVSGLISSGETVTWKAKHLMKMRFMKIRINSMSRPFNFIDEMVEGDLREMKHEHHFKQIENGTLMIDLLSFEAPYGTLGKLMNSFYLIKYFNNLLEHRNRIIKEYAESKKWQQLLNA